MRGGRAGAEAGVVFCAAFPFCADVLRRGVRGPEGLRGLLLIRLGVVFGLLAFRFAAGVFGEGAGVLSSSLLMSFSLSEEGFECIGGLAIV